MKKIISGIVTLTIIGSIMTACGKIDESANETDTSITLEANEEVKVTDTKEASTEIDFYESKTVSDTEKESENKSYENTGEKETNEKDFEKILYAYFEALNESYYEKAEQTLTDKNQLILVYCRSGRRSKLASAQLAKMGYTNVKEFAGIIDWSYGTVSE